DAVEPLEQDADLEHPIELAMGRGVRHAEIVPRSCQDTRHTSCKAKCPSPRAKGIPKAHGVVIATGLSSRSQSWRCRGRCRGSTIRYRESGTACPKCRRRGSTRARAA